MTRPPVFPVLVGLWAELSGALPKPWTRDAVLIDLRWWTARGRIPSSAELGDRWGWTTTATAEVLEDRSAWLDRTLPPPKLDPSLVPPPRKTAGKYRRSTDRPTHLHLTSRWREVLAICRSHPEYKDCVRQGWEREDLDQEVAIRLIQKQEAGSAYDGERAGFGKYIWTSTRSILLHLLEQRGTMKATKIVTGVVRKVDVDGGSPYGTHWQEVDAAHIAVADLWDPVEDIDRMREGS